MAQENDAAQNAYAAMMGSAARLGTLYMEYCSKMFFNGIEVYNAWLAWSMNNAFHLMGYDKKSYQDWKSKPEGKKDADAGGPGPQ